VRSCRAAPGARAGRRAVAADFAAGKSRLRQAGRPEEGARMTDETHDARRQSWVASAQGHSEFPLQNLPFGVFSPPGRTAPDARARGGVAIGDMIFDIRAALAAG